MTNKGEINISSTTTIKMDSGCKICKGNKHHKSSKEKLFDPTPSKALACHRHLTIETSDNYYGDEAIDATIGQEWVTRVQMER
ncbi:hypothetical protein EJD97_017763 [Solanum chilense]|uniref:Uncharacterized protein n=1 Tax=Solanum chilense TaxID=4083 RepID=A0A6N2B4V4_SOLCI|nr:hypothetical protein EJD97_017763 [Solanum chilense]